MRSRFKPSSTTADGPAGQIDDHTRQGFVERSIGVGEARDTGTITECLMKCLPKGECTIFGGVVVVDLQIALTAQVQIEPGMPGQADQHVIEKADAGLDIGRAAAVQGQTKLDCRFRRGALDRAAAWCQRWWRWYVHGTICASDVTSMSVPPRALISGMMVGRSFLRTAALSAKP